MAQGTLTPISLAELRVQELPHRPLCSCRSTMLSNKDHKLHWNESYSLLPKFDFPHAHQKNIQHLLTGAHCYKYLFPPFEGVKRVFPVIDRPALTLFLSLSVSLAKHYLLHTRRLLSLYICVCGGLLTNLRINLTLIARCLENTNFSNRVKTSR